MPRALSREFQEVMRPRTFIAQMDNLLKTRAPNKQPQRLMKLLNNERHTTGEVMTRRLHCIHAASACWSHTLYIVEHSQQVLDGRCGPFRSHKMLCYISLLLVCRQLLAAAKDGRTEDATAVLTSMEEAGLPPGPRAYHGLICAHCKAGDTDSALATVRKAVQQGRFP